MCNFFYKNIESNFCFIILPLQGSRDNMSIIIIALPGAPKPTPEAIEAETELNQKIYELIKGCYCFKCLNRCYHYVRKRTKL